MKIQFQTNMVQFGDVQSEFNVDLILPIDQHIVAIYGPSGSGKSTLLNVIAGTFGYKVRSKLCFEGETWQDTEQENRPFCLVSDKTPLFTHLSAEQNLRLVAENSQFSGRLCYSFDQVVKWCGINELLHKMPSMLSTGESQRVKFGRALLSGKPVLLLDEAFSALDWASRMAMNDLLLKLKSEYGLRFIMVSHSLHELATSCGYFVHLTRGEVQLTGESASTLSQIARQTTTVSQLAVEHVSREAKYQLDCWALVGHPELQVHTHIRHNERNQKYIVLEGTKVVLSQAVSNLSSMVNQLPAIIQHVELKPDFVLVTLSTGGQTLLAEISAMSQERMNLSAGQTVYAQFKVI